MPEPVRLLTSPFPVAGGLDAGTAAAAVAADALLRRAWVVGSQGEWARCAMAADQASQHALERELAREGQDRDTVGGAELAERAAAFGEACRAAAAEALATLGVAADELAPLDDPAHVVAARTAFVRLFDEGMIERRDRVVATCPRCTTVVDGDAVVDGHVEGERLSVRFDEGLVVDLLAPELLPGVVAVAVPEGDERVGDSVLVPLAGREVPVVAVDGVERPTVLVPAHDPGSHELAERLGLSPVVVLAGDGTVVAEGPLTGQARYAARAAARDLLAAEGRIAASEPAPERLDRCACCGTVLVPLLGRHWFLRFADLAGAAADLVRDGALQVTPPEFRDLLLSAAATAKEWCLSGTVVGGVRLPVATCHDCGRTAVEVEERGSCGRCMGTLEAAAESLDALFVAAIWPLVAGGWPAGAPTGEPAAVAVVTPADLVRWALPALALGARLGGLPFAKVVVHPLGPLDATLDDVVTPSPDPRAARLALLAGRHDTSTASAAVDAFDAALAATGEPEADADVAAAVIAGAEAVVAALDDGAPARAGLLLEALLAAGVPTEAADRVHALALPLLGA